MKKIVLFVLLFVLYISNIYAQAVDRADQGYSKAMFGMGVQVASTTSLLFSWQSAESNPYGHSWRLEPSIAFSSSDNEAAPPQGHTVSASLTLGLGYYWRWKVRAPFDNLYFSMGPRASITGYTSSAPYEIFADTVIERIGITQQHFSTNLSFLAAPEYAIDQWSQHFTVAGYFSIGATINGRTKTTGTSLTSAWGLTTSTGTGIILRYYFM